MEEILTDDEIRSVFNYLQKVLGVKNIELIIERIPFVIPDGIALMDGIAELETRKVYLKINPFMPEEVKKTERGIKEPFNLYFGS